MTWRRPRQRRTTPIGLVALVLCAVLGALAPASASAGASVSPDSVAFGEHKVGTTSPPRTVTVRNTGEGDLTLTDVRLTGAHPDQFSLDADPGSCGSPVLQPNGACSVRVRYEPTAAGSHSASLTFTYNADGSIGSTATVALSGTAIAGLASVSPPSMTFGSRDVGTVSPLQTATLTNTGTSDLTIANVALAGANPGQFTLDRNTCTANAVVAPGANCTVTVKHAPSAVGAHSAVVRFTNDSGATAGSTQDVALSATATTPGGSPATPQPAAADAAGTPAAPDADADGVPDAQDRCPDQPSTLPEGCPDSDGDGKNDRDDACPQAPGDLANGCQRRLGADIRGIWRVSASKTKMLSLYVLTPVGSRIEVSCKSKRKDACTFSERTIEKTEKRTTSLTKYFKNMRVMPAEVIIVVRVTKVGRVGAYERLQTRSGRRLPKVVERCISYRDRTFPCT